jgi:FtsH-binding integral membrane protein
MALTSTNTPSAAALGVQQTIEVVGLVLSTAFLSAINIAVSGHLLGYALNLRRPAQAHFTLGVPWVFSVKIRGITVLAGFAAYSLSLLLVGLTLSSVAKTVFIANLEATKSPWTACQAFAGVITVFACLLLASLRIALDTIQIKTDQRRRETAVETPAERAKRLVQGN